MPQVIPILAAAEVQCSGRIVAFLGDGHHGEVTMVRYTMVFEYTS